MNNNLDIEDTLKRYRSDPSSQVKRSVLTRFIHTFENKGSAHTNVVFWKQPIPLYVVAAIIIISAGVSFFAGQRTPQHKGQQKVLHESLQEQPTTSSQEITWVAALSDLL